MSNKERGERIRQQILRDVKHHPADISKHISNIFSITPQAVYSHIKRLEVAGWISSTGSGRGKRYALGDLRNHAASFLLEDNFEEDRAWRDHYSFVFEDIPEHLFDICHYGFTEIVNNAIDHSGGKIVYISASRTKDKLEIYVIDDGEGIFRKIKRMCDLADERQALLELSKGKLTTDPDHHTGEGIFFTSRVFDDFEIDSKGVTFSHFEGLDFDFILESPISRNEAGTLVYMSISRASQRRLGGVFDQYTAGPDDFQFNKTVIPVRLAQYGNEKLISRSQAKRMLIRVENFANVIFDFAGVSYIGQAFADEIFRVYASGHPEIVLAPLNMEHDVEKMVNKALFARQAQEEA